MLQAKNGCLGLSAGEMDYIRFGCGPRPLVMIPGVGDGLKTVKGMALPFALLYRSLAKDFTVYVFSRRRALGLQPGEKCYMISRVRKADGSPMAYEEAYVPYKICPNLQRHIDEETSLYMDARMKYFCIACEIAKRIDPGAGHGVI